MLLFPVAWVHIPKTGTTFVNTLIRSVCAPSFVPFEPGGSQHDFWSVSRNATHDFSSGKDSGMRLSMCNFTSSPQYNGYASPPGHRGFGSFASLASHGVTVLRQPEQRVISGFHHNFHSYDVNHHGEPSLAVYARAVAGCSVRMLVRGSRPESSDRGKAACGHAPPPSQTEVEHAKAILSAFQFVGLTEEWDMSVCLWHARFGPSSCDIHEFQNARPGSYTSRNTSVPRYDTSTLLGGFEDRFDGALYRHAEILFWTEVSRHKLTRTKCTAWKAACVSYSEK